MSAKHLLTFAAVVVIAGCAAGVPLARQDQQDPGLLVFNGYTNPKIDCYRCHNGDGHGTGHGPDLAKAVPDEHMRRCVSLPVSDFAEALGRMTEVATGVVLKLDNTIPGEETPFLDVGAGTQAQVFVELSGENVPKSFTSWPSVPSSASSARPCSR